MNNFFKNADFGKLIFRLAFGGLIFAHGVEGLMKGPESWVHTGSVMTHLGIHFGHATWGMIAAGIQAIAGLCFLLGVLFRPACLLLISVMGMAVFFHVQRADPLLTASGQAILFCAAFFAFLFIGSGNLSVQKDS